MPNGQDDRRSHFVLQEIGTAQRFTSPKSGGPAANVPVRDRPTHSAALRAQLQAAQEVVEADLGLQIEFRGFEGVEFTTESLARDRSGIELMNVREEGGCILATVYVPQGKLAHFERLIADYLAERRDKNDRPLDKRKLIDAIREIRLATVRALWTDAIDAFPAAPADTIAWEVWLPVRESRQQVLAEFRQLANGVGWQVSGRTVEFPERSVVICTGTQHQLEQSAHLLAMIAELRRAKETAAFFDALTPLEQQEWTDDLLARLQFAQQDSPHVCLLDTGVNRGHPLLSGSLAPADMHSVEPAWGTADAHGHGTGLAGIALFGDLVEPFAATGPVGLSARLESVKVLRQPGDNKDEPYGAITEEAVARAEITAPNRKRVFNLAVTATDTRDRGRPSSWSSTIDALASDWAGDGARPRLFIVSAGNCSDPNAWLTHPVHLETESIHDPAQSWNALTVGASTEKVQINDQDAEHYQPIALPGSLSPFTSTSFTWQQKGPPWKPDVVLEGGNAASDGGFASEMASLSLLTTHHLPQQRLLTTTNATSAATASVSRMAARISADYPALWPEAIRALIVHSARWTAQMEDEFATGTTPTARRSKLLRHCGYGVPSLERALWSAGDSLTLIVQDRLQPFEKSQSGIKSRDMHLHDLPWPAEALLELGELEVSLRVTLSYFIEPNPGARGAGDKYSYQSHALRFEVRRPGESTKPFLSRINRLARDEEEGTSTAAPDQGWTIGDQLRRRGSLHSDVWTGTAAELANRGFVAVYPAVGWWRRRARLQRFDREARYALIVSIEAPESPLDLYELVAAKIAAEIPT
jgi:Subtilase family